MDTRVVSHFAYNFIKIHRTLRVTPAMAAGLTDRLWEMADLGSVGNLSAEGGKSGVNLGYEQVAQHVLPCRASQPSLTIIGTINNPAAGSAHHQPKTAFNSSPQSRIPER